MVDTGPDGAASDGTTSDVPTADGDTTGDADGADAGTRRLVGPGDEEPPDTELEPGSDADHAYRYCWYLSRILCNAAHACCFDRISMAGIFGEDVDECISLLEPASCDVYLVRPDAFGPQNVDELEGNLETLWDAALECEEPDGAKFGFLIGDLPVGGDCSAPDGADPLNNPHFLCERGRPCISGRCAEFSDIGGSCRYPAACDLDVAACEDRMCVERENRPLDATCSRDHECASRRCRDAVCVPPGDTWCFGAD